jgi:N-hydroxyarylamine O-acetyltransferase
MTSALDIAAYFRRIGYTGSVTPTRSTLDAITCAHAQAIPFENIDVLLGQPIRLTTEALFEKLVVRRRGGYCFEQNGLMLAVLENLGFDVTPISARVRIDRPRSVTPPRTHLFLRVELDGESWLTDVGVGALSLTGALRLMPEVVQPTPHEPRRLMIEGGRWFHQVALADEWHDVSEFTLEVMPLIDRVVANWYTSTSPESHFKDRLVVARAAPDGRRITLRNDLLSVRERDGSATKQQLLTARELRSVLSQAFRLEVPEELDLHPPGVSFS